MLYELEAFVHDAPHLNLAERNFHYGYNTVEMCASAQFVCG